MRIQFNHFHHPDRETAERLCRIEQMLGELMETIMPTIEDLKASVQKNSDAEASVVALLQGVSQQLRAAQAANDPAAIQAVIDQIDANTNAAAAAVVANTPAANAPSAAPVAPAAAAAPSDPAAPSA